MTDRTEDFFAGTRAPDDEPAIAMGFTGNTIIRDSEKQDSATFAAALADPAARFLLFVGADLRLPSVPDDRAGQVSPYVTRDDTGEADLDRAILLGHLDGAPVFAAPLPAPNAPDPQNPATYRAGQYGDAQEVIDLRSLAMHGIVNARDLGVIGHAGGLMNWHRGHRHCARCGAATIIEQGGYRRGCPECGRHHFPRTDPVVIMLAIDGDRCVLGRQPRFVENMYSCLAGFVEPGETMEAAVRRELREESGLEIGRVKYHSSQPWPFPHSLMIGCHAEASSFDIHADEDELEDCRWFTRAEAKAMLDKAHPDGLFTPPPMAIAHHLLRDWVEAESS